MKAAKGSRRSVALALGGATLLVAILLGAYFRATRPDEPLDRLHTLHVRDDHQVVFPNVNRSLTQSHIYWRLLKVEDDPESVRSALAIAVANQGWKYESFKPRVMGDYGSFSTTINGVAYEIRITPGGSGVYTQISESREATRPEVLKSNFEDFLVRVFGRSRAAQSAETNR